MLDFVILLHEQGDCNIRITSNSRNFSNSRELTTAGTPTTARTLTTECTETTATTAEKTGTPGTPIAEQTSTTAWRAAAIVETLAIEGTPGTKTTAGDANSRGARTGENTIKRRDFNYSRDTNNNRNARNI